MRKFVCPESGMLCVETDTPDGGVMRDFVSDYEATLQWQSGALMGQVAEIERRQRADALSHSGGEQ